MIYFSRDYIVTIKRLIIKSRKDSLRRAAIKDIVGKIREKKKKKKGFNEIELYLLDTGIGYYQLCYKAMC